LVKLTPLRLRDSGSNPNTTNQPIQSSIHLTLKQSPEFNLLHPLLKQPKQAALHEDLNINPPLRLLPSTNPRRSLTLQPRDPNPIPIAIPSVGAMSISVFSPN
jgi:hypothetical protein